MIAWPPLAGIPCVSGRPATIDDVNAGRAVFVLQDGENAIGVPLAMLIPQYAIHDDAESSTKTACIVIQAERTEMGAILGCVSVVDGEMIVGGLHEFELLGASAP